MEPFHFFFKLPLEIREQIYRYALVSNDAICCPDAMSRRSLDSAQPNYGLTLGLLRTCRQVLEEASKFLYQDNHFLFKDTTDIAFAHHAYFFVMYDVFSSQNFIHLQHITILSPTRGIRGAGWVSGHQFRALYPKPDTSLQALAYCKNLKSLTYIWRDQVKIITYMELERLGLRRPHDSHETTCNRFLTYGDISVIPQNTIDSAKEFALWHKGIYFESAQVSDPFCGYKRHHLDNSIELLFYQRTLTFKWKGYSSQTQSELWGNRFRDYTSMYGWRNGQLKTFL